MIDNSRKNLQQYTSDEQYVNMDPNFSRNYIPNNYNSAGASSLGKENLIYSQRSKNKHNSNNLRQQLNTSKNNVQKSVNFYNVPNTFGDMRSTKQAPNRSNIMVIPRNVLNINDKRVFGKNLMNSGYMDTNGNNSLYNNSNNTEIFSMQLPNRKSAKGQKSSIFINPRSFKNTYQKDCSPGIINPRNSLVRKIASPLHVTFAEQPCAQKPPNFNESSNFTASIKNCNNQMQKSYLNIAPGQRQNIKKNYQPTQDIFIQNARMPNCNTDKKQQ